MPPPCNHTRYPEPSGTDCRRLRIRIRRYRLFEEIFDQIFESCIFSGCKTTLKDRTQSEPLLQEQPKIALCAANVSGENHGLSSYTCAWSRCFSVGSALMDFPTFFCATRNSK